MAAALHFFEMDRLSKEFSWGSFAVGASVASAVCAVCLFVRRRKGERKHCKGEHGHCKDEAKAKTNEKKETPVFGGVEGGGTSFLATIAKGTPTNIVLKQRFDTTTPDETLSKVVSFFKSNRVDAIGIACFGPVQLNPTHKQYGFITTTPKPGWKFVDVVTPFKVLGVPIQFQTDVNAAALGELRHGGHGVRSQCCYVTVGTGVGVGVVVNGTPVTGLVHPEGGHIRIERYVGDKYEGNCPYHKDCLEGLVNSAAAAARCGCDRSELKTVPDSHPAWEVEAFYLAQLCGGVCQRASLFPKIHEHFVRLINGYISHDKMKDTVSQYIVPSAHGENAGSVGALELSRVALEENS